MKLQVSEVTSTGDAIAFHGTIDATDWQSEPEGKALREAPEIEGTYYRDGRRVYIEGQLYVHGRYACTRCLEKTDCRRTLPFAETYTTDEPSIDELPFDGISIDMDALARDILIMAEGDRVLCRDDCEGLCPGCGVNLNHESCQCEPENVPSQWAALDALLTKDE